MRMDMAHDSVQLWTVLLTVLNIHVLLPLVGSCSFGVLSRTALRIILEQINHIGAKDQKKKREKIRYHVKCIQSLLNSSCRAA
jgi:hypothetical protein